MSTEGPAGPGQVSRLSGSPDNPVRWVLGIFAHNEAGRIGTAVASAVPASDQQDLHVVVLANGCQDATIDEVRQSAGTVANLTLVDIPYADKANAWNIFVHDVVPLLGPPEPDLCFFMDGDVTLEPHAVSRLASVFDQAPSIQGAGGMPATGRDREDWSRRMVATGTLAGAFYALRGTFLEELRRQGIKMPIGLIGEDFFISWLIGQPIGNASRRASGPRVGFHPDARFTFRSLSLTRPHDYVVYARRRWRYTWRALQHRMLTGLLLARGFGAMPIDVEELYRVGPLPSRMVWVGRDTPLRLAALMAIRKRRAAR